MLIKLKNSELFAIIDDCDYEKISQYEWRVANRRKAKYAISTINGFPVFMHRLILGLTQRSVHVDHKNKNGLDNRRDNIRTCDISQNNANRDVYKNNKLGVKGVALVENGKYSARITINKKLVYLGVFSQKDDAARAYDLAAIKLHGEFASLNFKE